MKRYLLILLVTCAALPAFSQRAANALTQEDYYYAYFQEVLKCADDLVDGHEKAYYYAIQDFDNDGVKELVMADVNKTKTVFKVKDGSVTIISPDYTIDNDKVNWDLVENFYTNVDADRSSDITLRHHPVFAYDIDIAANRFTVPGDVKWDDSIMKSTRYDRMIFKPHVGNIRFVKAEKGTYDSDGTPIELGVCYTYSLTDASATKKMFRGYSDGYAAPVIVPAAWLKDHNPLQFSRWLQGEKEPKVSAGARKIIENYYGDQLKVRKIKWLASCDANERSFYEVVFEPRNGKVLLAFVCLAEGEVVSARNSWFDQDKSDPNSLDIGPEINDMLSFAPEIMVMAATPQGLELYVRWHSLEGVHYDIWREVEDQWMTIVGNYHYVMAY